jgi:hypothetical protein
MKSAFLISCLMVLTGTSITVNAEKYFKWVDSNGVTHYSETKPGDIPATPIKVKTGSPTTEKPGILSTAAATGSSEPAALENPQPTEQQLAVQRSNCSKASRKLIALENAGRVRQLDEQTGEYRYLPNQEKLAEISKMRDYLKTNCRGR